jgi:hypothetical protein
MTVEFELDDNVCVALVIIAFLILIGFIAFLKHIQTMAGCGL